MYHWTSDNVLFVSNRVEDKVHWENAKNMTSLDRQLRDKLTDIDLALNNLSLTSVQRNVLIINAQFACDQCTKSFETAWGLTVHSSKVHKKSKKKTIINFS